MLFLNPRRLIAFALAAAAVSPAHAVQSSLPVMAVDRLASVDRLYQSAPATRIWFRPGGEGAAEKLVALLRRAPADGLAEGPRLAGEVEAAIALAIPANPLAQADADRLLSRAWIAYHERLTRLPAKVRDARGLPPKTVEHLLFEARTAPSLARHLDERSAMSPIYGALRDAIAAAGPTADPRLLLNRERARAIPAGGRFLLVNSADQTLSMYEDGRPIGSMRIVVGKAVSPTPLIVSTIHYVTLNPYWNVPENLIHKTVAPTMLRQGRGYLDRLGYEVMKDWTADSAVLSPTDIDWKAVAAGRQDIRIRQQPGPYNSMGKIKFGFPNDEQIFLHDTPTRSYFAKDRRDLSNGCVRVEDARGLARWLLGRDAAPEGSAPEQFVRTPAGVPVILTYLTARADGGALRFLPDPYGWDRPDPLAAE